MEEIKRIKHEYYIWIDLQERFGANTIGANRDNLWRFYCIECQKHGIEPTKWIHYNI